MSLSAERLDRYRKEQEVEATRKSGGDFIKYPYFNPPQNKPVSVRVLPGLDPSDVDGDFFVKVLQHYNVNPAVKIPVVCPRNMGEDHECPICARVGALYSTKNQQDITQAGYIKVRSRFFMGVIPLEGENAGQICIWAAPKVIKDNIINLFQVAAYGDVTDPRTGRDLIVTKTGEKLDTSYQILPVPTTSAITDDDAELAVILQNQPPLYLLKKAAPADQIRLFMSGEISSLVQGFGTARKSSLKEEEDEEAAAFTNVAQTAPVAAPAAPAPVVHAVVAAAASPAKRKFDLSSIQNQINKINGVK